MQKLKIFPEPISLEKLRDLWLNFSPPQDCRYMTLENNRNKIKKTTISNIQPIVLKILPQKEYLIRL